MLTTRLAPPPPPQDTIHAHEIGSPNSPVMFDLTPIQHLCFPTDGRAPCLRTAQALASFGADLSVRDALGRSLRVYLEAQPTANAEPANEVLGWLEHVVRHRYGAFEIAAMARLPVAMRWLLRHTDVSWAEAASGLVLATTQTKVAKGSYPDDQGGRRARIHHQVLAQHMLHLVGQALANPEGVAAGVLPLNQLLPRPPTEGAAFVGAAPSTETRRLALQACKRWAPSRHMLYHAAFRATVRTVYLVGARFKPNGRAVPDDCWAMVLGFLDRGDFSLSPADARFRPMPPSTRSCSVRIRGLKNRTDLNGRIGTATYARASTQSRVSVRLHESEVPTPPHTGRWTGSMGGATHAATAAAAVAVAQVAAQGGAPAAAAQAAAAAVAANLVSADHHAGAPAPAAGSSGGTQGTSDGNTVVSIHRENVVTRCPPRPRVKLRGLTKRSELNGRVGVILEPSLVRLPTDRLLVELTDGPSCPLSPEDSAPAAAGSAGNSSGAAVGGGGSATRVKVRRLNLELLPWNPGDDPTKVDQKYCLGIDEHKVGRLLQVYEPVPMLRDLGPAWPALDPAG